MLWLPNLIPSKYPSSSKGKSCGTCCLKAARSVAHQPILLTMYFNSVLRGDRIKTEMIRIVGGNIEVAFENESCCLRKRLLWRVSGNRDIRWC